jgi:hypothetical protein
MIFREIGMVTTGAVAIGRIDVLRMHAAEVYVAPAIGEFFGCRYWHNHAGSFFFGRWLDVERAHTLLGAVRSAMDRDFLSFFEAGAGAENPKALAASFSRGMGQRLSQRLRRRKAGRGASVLARGKEIATDLARLCRTCLVKIVRRRTPSSSTLAYAAGVEAGDRVQLLEHKQGGLAVIGR